jgi:hypothetical protein
MLLPLPLQIKSKLTVPHTFPVVHNDKFISHIHRHLMWLFLVSNNVAIWMFQNISESLIIVYVGRHLDAQYIQGMNEERNSKM